VSDQIVQDLWNDRTGWSATADRLKSSRVRWRSVALTLTIAGAALETLASTLSNMSKAKTITGAAGAVCLAFVPFLTARILTPEETRKWLRARSISEGMKSEIFWYRAGADPYAGPDALDTLRKKVREIQSWGKGLEIERALATPPSSQPPPQLDPDAYLQARVYQQVTKYYRPKARLRARRAKQFQWAETALGGLAALLGAYASFPGSATVGPWVAVLTTIAGSITAHAAASRYDFEATTFVATAAQLEDLAHDWQASGKSAPSKEWSDVVRACEEAISAENRGWMAKLEQNPDPAR
jgi:hypothetical protein